MNVGTKSLLFGVHQFLWHPFTVWRAWCQIYGQRPSWRQCVCIFVHDWGYWGCESMDGPDGINHPHFGGDIASDLFDTRDAHEWRHFMLGHSRHLSKKLGIEPSQLCWADKYCTCFYPSWLYLFLARLSGEIHEYRANSDRSGFCPGTLPDHVWLAKLKRHEADRAINMAATFKRINVANDKRNRS